MPIFLWYIEARIRCWHLQTVYLKLKISCMNFKDEAWIIDPISPVCKLTRSSVTRTISDYSIGWKNSYWLCMRELFTVKCETAPAIFGRTYFIFIVVVVVVVIFHMRVGMSSLVKIQHFSSSAKIQENNINLFSNDNGMIRAQVRSNPQWVEHIDHVTLAHHKHAHFEIEGCPEECHNEISSVCWKKSRP